MCVYVNNLSTFGSSIMHQLQQSEQSIARLRIKARRGAGSLSFSLLTELKLSEVNCLICICE